MRCLFDYNAASGIECVDATITLEDCVVHSNLAGVGINGEHAVYNLSRCNIFSNRLNGVEVMDTAAAPLITQCEVRNNLHGVILWRALGVETTALANGLIAANHLQGNRAGEARIKVRDPGQTLVEAAEADGVCTFTYTGPHFYPHVQTGCRTCGLDGNFVPLIVEAALTFLARFRRFRDARMLLCVCARLSCRSRPGRAYAC